MATNLEMIQSDALHISDIVHKHSEQLPSQTVKLLNTLTSNIRTFAERTKDDIHRFASVIAGKPEQESSSGS